jgi:DNA (cytosine-5)-methyltransferase 1
VGIRDIFACGQGMNVIGLFSGIGGIEEGFRRAGLSTELLCEAEPAARKVLKHRFPELCVEPDVRELASLPKADVLAAGGRPRPA